MDRFRAERAEAAEALRLMREEAQGADVAEEPELREERAAALVDRIAQLDTLIHLHETLDG